MTDVNINLTEPRGIAVVATHQNEENGHIASKSDADDGSQMTAAGRTLHVALGELTTAIGNRTMYLVYGQQPKVEPVECITLEMVDVTHVHSVGCVACGTGLVMVLSSALCPGSDMSNASEHELEKSMVTKGTSSLKVKVTLVNPCCQVGTCCSTEPSVLVNTCLATVSWTHQHHGDEVSQSAQDNFHTSALDVTGVMPQEVDVSVSGYGPDDQSVECAVVVMSHESVHNVACGYRPTLHCNSSVVMLQSSGALDESAVQSADMSAESGESACECAVGRDGRHSVCSYEVEVHMVECSSVTVQNEHCCTLDMDKTVVWTEVQSGSMPVEQQKEMSCSVRQYQATVTIGGFGIGKMMLTCVTSVSPDASKSDIQSVVLIGCVVKCTSESIGWSVQMTYCSSEVGTSDDYQDTVPWCDEDDLSERDVATSDERLTADTLSTRVSSCVTWLERWSTSAGDVDQSLLAGLGNAPLDTTCSGATLIACSMETPCQVVGSSTAVHVYVTNCGEYLNSV